MAKPCLVQSSQRDVKILRGFKNKGLMQESALGVKDLLSITEQAWWGGGVGRLNGLLLFMFFCINFNQLQPSLFLFPVRGFDFTSQSCLDKFLRCKDMRVNCWVMPLN